MSVAGTKDVLSKDRFMLPEVSSRIMTLGTTVWDTNGGTAL